MHESSHYIIFTYEYATVRPSYDSDQDNIGQTPPTYFLEIKTSRFSTKIFIHILSQP